MPIDYEKHYEALYGTSSAGSSVSVYDQITEKDRSRRVQNLKIADRAASRETPESAAEDLRIAEQTGVPRRTVSRNRERIRDELTLDGPDYESIVDRYQGLSSWLEEDPDNVVIARDDYEQLQRLEDVLHAGDNQELVGVFEGTAQSFSRGREDVRLANLNAKDLLGRLTPEEAAERDRLSESLNNQTVLATDNPVGQFLFDAGRQAPILGAVGLQAAERGGQAGLLAGGATLLAPGGQAAAPFTATGAFTAGAITGATEQSFLLEAGFAYDEYRQFRDENGDALDDTVARSAAILAGSVNAGLELTGLRSLARAIPGLRNIEQLSGRRLVSELLKRPTFRQALGRFGARYGETLTVETATEAVQELVTTLTGEAAQAFSGQDFGEGPTIVDLLDRSANAGATAFRATTILGLPGPVAGLAVDARRAQRAQQDVRVVEALNESAAESKTRQRVPERFRDFVDRATADGPVDNVYVDVNRWDELFQSEGVDPQDAAAEVFDDGGKAYAEAKTEGGDLVIPTGRYAEKIAGTEYASRLSPDVRLSVDAMSARDAQQWQADLEQTLQEIEDGQSQNMGAFTEIRDDIVGQLVNAGIRQQEAEASATPTAAFIVTQAEREGLDPRELYQSRRQRVSRPLPEVLRNRGGTLDTQIDPMIDRVRAADIPSEREVFGTSLLEFLRGYGLQPDSELDARDADASRAPFQRRLIREDAELTLDDAALFAWEEGYIRSPEGPDARPTPDDLLEAIDSELAGEPVYRMDVLDTPEAQEREALQELDAFFGASGVDLSEISNEEARRILDEAAEQEGEVEFDQTVSLRRGTQTLRPYGISGNQSVRTREVAAALEARQRRRFGEIDRNDRSDEAKRRISGWMLEEVMFEVEQAQADPERSAVGWYTTKFQNALDQLGEAYPELVDEGAFGDDAPAGVQLLGNQENARNLLTALIAITSDGAKVADNFRFATTAYEAFRQNGVIDSDVSFGGERNSSMRINLSEIQNLIETLGPEQMHQFLLEREKVSELNRLAREEGRDLNSGYLASMELPRAAVVFGPKLGAFYANLMGDTGYLTMDRWWSRAFNRYRGTLLQQPTRKGLNRFKRLVVEDQGLSVDPDQMTDDEAIARTVDYVKSYKAKGFKRGTKIEKAANTIYKAAFENLQDSPYNGADRQFMVETVAEAQQRLARRGVDLSVADIQAVLWYYEKRLYGEMGARQTADISYEEVARNVAENRRDNQDDRLARSNDEVAGNGLGSSESLNQADSEAVDGDPLADTESEQSPQDVELQQGRRGSIRFQPEGDVEFDQADTVSPRLLAVHNISAENLQSANELGGLAVPSIGVITDQSGDVRGFGEITLIGREGLADPSQERVFSSDAYTARFPRPEWRAANREDVQEIFDEVKAIDEEFDGYLANPTLDLMLERPDANELVNVWLRSVSGRVLFLRERGFDVSPVMQSAPMSSRIPAEVVEQLAPLVEQIDRNQSPNELLESDEFQELARAYESRLTEYYRREGVREELLSGLVRELRFGRLDRLMSDVQMLGSEVIDQSATRDQIENLVEPLEAEYKNWVEDKLVPKFGDPFLTVNGREAPYTLPNIVEFMTEGEARGAEQTFVYGTGQARAASASQFSDIEQMREAAENAIVDPDEYGEAKAAVEQTLENYREMMGEYEFEVDDTFERLDASMRAIAKFSTSNEKTRQGMRSSLESEGFLNTDSIPDQEIDFAIEAANDLLEAPVPYFEAKPSRSVDLSEFAGAVVPDDAPDQTISLLEEQGISTQLYEAGNDEARSQAVRDLANEIEQSGERVFFQAQDQQGRRGSIRFQPEGDERVFNITLFDKANLSTYLHESGHYFLEVLGDLVEREGASERLREDYQRILKFLEVDSREQIGTAQHEKWARAFEAYLREGRAPSPELQSAFAKFRAWLVALYRQIRQLDVELTDEVRGVMDRMLATDEQIDAAYETQNYRAMFDSAEQAGMSAEQFSDYQRSIERARAEAEEDLTKRMMGELQREQKEWWKEAREAKREEVEREVYAQPGYRALFFLQKGRLPFDDGGPKAFKLDRQELAQKYGKPFLKRLPGPKSDANRGAYIYTREGGMSPGMAATMFEFGSADEMVKTLVNLRDAREFIEAETDVRMRNEYGDMLTDGSVAQEAMDAVHNRARADLLSRELQLLNRRRGGRGPSPVAQIRMTAEQQINQKRVMDIRPDQYRRAESKAARASYQAALQQDFETAFTEKQRQIYNHYLYRAAREARDQAEKDRRRILKFNGKTQRTTLGKAGEDYLQQVEAILADHDFTAITNRDVRRRMSLREWLAEKNAEFNPIEEPEYVAAGTSEQITNAAEREVDPRNPSLESLAKEASRVAWKEMTPEEISGVRQNLEMIYHLAKLKTDMIQAGEKRSLDEVVAEVESSIRENANRQVVQNLQPERRGAKAAKARDEFLSQSRRIPSYAREMDGGEEGGAVWRNIIQPLNRATSDYNERIKSHGDRLAELYNTHYSKSEQAEFLKDPVYYESIDASLTKDAVLAIALNWGNETNRERLMSGEGWTEWQVRQVFNTLEKRDWDFVQSMWDYIEEYWPEFRENHRQLYGIPPEKVSAMPVQTQFGEYRGGYYPIKFDSTRSTRTNERQFAEQGQRFQNPANRQRAGASQQRVRGEVRMPLKLSVASVVNQHVNEVIKHVTFDRPLLDVARVVTRDEVKEAIVDNYGQEIYNRIYRLLVDVRWGTKPAENVMERTLDHVRNGMSVATMGLSITTALLQPLGLSNSLVVLGGDQGTARGGYWVLRGLARMGGSAVSMENAARFALERSAFMRVRRENTSREVGDVLNRLQGKGWKSKVQRAAFWMTTNLQFAAVDLPTWYGAYEKALSAGFDETTSAEVADQAVRDAQGGGDLIDQTELQRGGPAVRLFTNFLSYMSTTYSIQAERYRSYDLRTFNGLARLVSDHLMLAVVPSVGSAIIYGMRDAGEDDEGDFASEIALEYINMLTGPFVGVRDFTGVLRGYGYDGPAGLTVGGEVARFFQQIGQVAEPFSEGDIDDAAENIDRPLVRSGLMATGIIFHLPATQVDRTIFGTGALLEGDTNNPAAVLFGPPSEQ